MDAPTKIFYFTVITGPVFEIVHCGKKKEKGKKLTAALRVKGAETGLILAN